MPGGVVRHEKTGPRNRRGLSPAIGIDSACLVRMPRRRAAVLIGDELLDFVPRASLRRAERPTRTSQLEMRDVTCSG